MVVKQIKKFSAKYKVECGKVLKNWSI